MACTNSQIVTGLYQSGADNPEVWQIGERVQEGVLEWRRDLHCRGQRRDRGGGKHRPCQKGEEKNYLKNDKDDVFLLQITRLVFNRLGVAGAVLQTPL